MDQIAQKFEQPKINTEQSLSPEKIEKVSEQVVERSPENTETIASEILQSAQTSTTSLPAKNLDNQVVLAKVEAVLATGLDSIFLSMDVQQQQKFKVKGEETARKISSLLNSAKATVGKIVDLIIEWLRLIPNVNRHFLEQEAKIKADEIMELYSGKK